MDLGLAGRRAVVAAATSGLGLGTAATLVAEGASVSICGRDPKRLSRALEWLRASASSDGQVHGEVVDVRDESAIDAWVTAAEERFGGLDIAVANAGGPPKGPASVFDVGDYREALELNLLPSIALVERVLPSLRVQGWGRVVFISSMSVLDPLPGLALSNVARPGVVGYAKSLVAELGDRPVTVNVAAPGRHDTPRAEQGTDVHGRSSGSLGSPADFGAVVAFLCSRQAAYIHGAIVPIDGGAHGGLI